MGPEGPRDLEVIGQASLARPCPGPLNGGPQLAPVVVPSRYPQPGLQIVHSYRCLDVSGDVPPLQSFQGPRTGCVIASRERATGAGQREAGKYIHGSKTEGKKKEEKVD